MVFACFKHSILCNGRHVVLIGRALGSVSNVNSSSKNPAKLLAYCGQWTGRTKPPAVKQGSASFKQSRCFHLVSMETGHREKLDVIFDSISASTGTIFPLPSGRAMLKLVAPREGGWFDVALILLIFIVWVRRTKWRLCARCSVTSEVHDTESSKSLARVVYMTGPTIFRGVSTGGAEGVSAPHQC